MKIKITLDDSIGDKVILAIVSALVGAEISAKDKLAEWNQRMNDTRSFIFSIDIVAPQILLDKGLCGLLEGTLTSSFRLAIIDIFEDDYTIDQLLSDDIITHLATPTRRAYAQAAGILIGAEAGSLVDLSRLVLTTEQKQRILLVLPSEQLSLYQKMLDFFQDFGQLIGLSVMLIDEYIMLYKDRLQLVAESALVVGTQTFCTYAASCLRVPCLEIVHSQQEINILSKWSSPKYGVLLYNDFEHLTMQRLQTILAKWKALGETTLTQKEILGVNVDGI